MNPDFVFWNVNAPGFNTGPKVKCCVYLIGKRHVSQGRWRGKWCKESWDLSEI